MTGLSIQAIRFLRGQTRPCRRSSANLPCFGRMSCGARRYGAHRVRDRRSTGARGARIAASRAVRALLSHRRAGGRTRRGAAPVGRRDLRPHHALVGRRDPRRSSGRMVIARTGPVVHGKRSHSRRCDHFLSLCHRNVEQACAFQPAQEKVVKSGAVGPGLVIQSQSSIPSYIHPQRSIFQGDSWGGVIRRDGPWRGAVGGCRARSHLCRVAYRAASYASSPSLYGDSCRHGRGESPPFEPDTHPDCPGAGGPPDERETDS